jgi:hypothetical protein
VTLSGKYTKKLYNSLNRVDAAILAQIRTNISRLNTLHKIKVAETDKCDCGALGTVQHFVSLCPRWRQKRQGMRTAHGSRYCNISYTLGGYSDQGQVETRLECSKSHDRVCKGDNQTTNTDIKENPTDIKCRETNYHTTATLAVSPPNSVRPIRMYAT